MVLAVDALRYEKENEMMAMLRDTGNGSITLEQIRALPDGSAQRVQVWGGPLGRGFSVFSTVNCHFLRSSLSVFLCS